MASVSSLVSFCNQGFIWLFFVVGLITPAPPAGQEYRTYPSKTEVPEDVHQAQADFKHAGACSESSQTSLFFPVSVCFGLLLGFLFFWGWVRGQSTTFLFVTRLLFSFSRWALPAVVFSPSCELPCGLWRWCSNLHFNRSPGRPLNAAPMNSWLVSPASQEIP